MDKKVWIIGIAAVSLLLIAGLATAQGMWKNKDNQEFGIQGMGAMHGNMMKGMMGGMMQGNMMKGMTQHHEQMDELFEAGTYADLVKLREEQDFSIMPWVENEEDFQLAKKMHEKMEKSGGCQMMNGNPD